LVEFDLFARRGRGCWRWRGRLRDAAMTVGGRKGVEAKRVAHAGIGWIGEDTRAPGQFCRSRGDETHFNPGCSFQVRASSRRLIRHGAGESSAVPLKIRAPGFAGRPFQMRGRVRHFVRAVFGLRASGGQRTARPTNRRHARKSLV
jgi:hypothetical protein